MGLKGIEDRMVCHLFNSGETEVLDWLRLYSQGWTLGALAAMLPETLDERSCCFGNPRGPAGVEDGRELASSPPAREARHHGTARCLTCCQAAALWG